MNEHPRVLIIGTADTKADEIKFLAECIAGLDVKGLVMDVGVLSTPPFAVDFSNCDVAAAANTTIEDIIALGDENLAISKMAEGASALALKLYEQGEIDGMIALGGSMGTDLALDVAAALPFGVPKYIVSTIAFSPVIEIERISPDLQMILWSGGLYGLNSLCKAVLSQAAGAIAGACRSVRPPTTHRPRIGVTSLGKSCLSYMVGLVPELEKRGYEIAAFHASGMGGRAFEALAARGEFVAVMDFALCEITNALLGGVLTAGHDRLAAASRRGVPQLLAPGSTDMCDFATWAELPVQYRDRDYHAHNRLVCSIGLTAEERREVARLIGEKLALATGPATLLMPLKGIEAWDREGAAMHNPDALVAFTNALRQHIRPPAELVEVEAHINDPAFVEKALSIFDSWVEQGLVPRGVA
ncbi:MAG: Tm-1-like ATP-binding domain-containing protein [Stellaceae bacterium]